MFQPCYTPAFAARRSATPWAPTCSSANGSCWQGPAPRTRPKQYRQLGLGLTYNPAGAAPVK